MLTLPLAGCFSSGTDTPKEQSLDGSIEAYYTLNEGAVFHHKLEGIKGNLAVASSEVDGVSLNAVEDGWELSFKAPWVKSTSPENALSESFDITLHQKVDEFKETKKTVTFYVMDIKDIPKIQFKASSIQPASVFVQYGEEEANRLTVKTRNEHGFKIPFEIVEVDADDVSIGLSISQSNSALNGAYVEQVGESLLELVVPIDVKNPLKDIDIDLMVYDGDGERHYVVTHRRVIVPKIQIDNIKRITVTKDKAAVVELKKNFSGSDYHIDVAYFEKNMEPIKNNVWIDHKLFKTDDFVQFSVNSVTEPWTGVVRFTVTRDNERGIYHFPITIK